MRLQGSSPISLRGPLGAGSVSLTHCSVVCRVRLEHEALLDTRGAPVCGLSMQSFPHPCPDLRAGASSHQSHVPSTLCGTVCVSARKQDGTHEGTHELVDAQAGRTRSVPGALGPA